MTSANAATRPDAQAAPTASGGVASGGKPRPRGKVAGQAPGAGMAEPQRPGRRFALPSATLLRLLRALAVLACLVAGGVGVYVTVATGDSLQAIDAGTQQVLRLQQIKGDILRADGLATNGLAQGAAEPLAQRQAYRQALQEAARLTVEASDAQPLDSGDLAAVNAALVNYTATLEYARTAWAGDPKAGAQYVAEAGDVLTRDTLPGLDKLIAAGQDRIAAAKAADRIWAVGLALLPVVLLLATSIWLARRTKRILNIGLALALLASALLWRLVDTNLTDTQAVVDSARQGSLQWATAASTAYSDLAEAKSIEGRQLLLPSQLTDLETRWTSSMDAVSAAVARLDGATASSIGGQLTTYKTAHAGVVNLLKQNRVTEARTTAANTATGVNPTQQAATDALGAAFSKARADTATEMSKQRDSLRFASVLAGLCGVLGAVAAAFGLTQRIREYR